MATESSPITEPEPFDLPRLGRSFTQQSPLAMVAVGGPTHIVRYVNPAFERLSGTSAGDLIGRSFAEAIPEGTANGCPDLLDRVYQTGIAEHLADQEHLRTSPAYWTYTIWAIPGGHEPPIGVMIQVTDTTEINLFRQQAVAMNEALVVSSVRQHELIDTIRRGEQERLAMQLQMFQDQKLESLGVLAGGLAHDLNNILTPVIGMAEMARDGLPADSPAQEMLNEVVSNALRAADLVSQILAYAGKGRFVLELIDLSRLVGEMRGLLRTAVPVGIELNWELRPGMPLIQADATQIRQVVLNLIINAAEAIGSKDGVITVQTGPTPETACKPAVQGPKTNAPAGPSVFLEVSDTGAGMSPELIDKIFEPFFTTKFTGRGLGLAVVQGIVRGHHGVLRVSSEPGRGTAFHMEIPAVAAKPSVLKKPELPETWQGSGTLLVIDDEPAVRDILGQILRRSGLVPVPAPNGREGLAVFHNNPNAIDAVILDMTMPGLSGLETLEALRATRPDLPVVLISGFSIGEAIEQSPGQGLTLFVQKPFKPAVLREAIRKALAQ